MEGSSADSSSRGYSDQPSTSHCNPEVSYEDMMEEDLTCPVCCGLYREPKALSCAHNLCRTCLEGVIWANSINMPDESPDTIKCPVCWEETPRTGPNAPRDNHLLTATVDKYITINNAPKQPTCPVHREQPLNIYCSTDQKLICGACGTSDGHENHEVSSLDNGVIQEKRLLLEWLVGFERAQLSLSQLESHKEKALQEISKDSDEVKSYFENLQFVLEQKKNEILSEWESKKEALKQEYDPEIKRQKAKVDEQREGVNVAKDLGEVSNPIDFLQEMQKFWGKFSLLQEEPLPSFSSVTSMQKIDTRAWDDTKLADMGNLSWPPKHPTKRQEIHWNISCWIWALSAVLIIFAMMMTALFFLSSNDFHPTYNDSGFLVVVYSPSSAEREAGRLSFYFTVEELTDMAESCLVYITDILETLAEFTSYFTCMKGPEEKQLLLGMEEKKASLHPTEKPTNKPIIKEEPAKRLQELEKIRFTDNRLIVHQYVRAVSSYVSHAMGKVARKITEYWRLVLKELHRTSGRCKTYTARMMERMVDFLNIRNQ
uniref:Uncharacterized protein n=1 Tax=Leptobrachium leishanense TaxID=445787 RepID=A0A8C5QIH5_9ANUR